MCAPAPTIARRRPWWWCSACWRYEDALKANKVKATVYKYPGTQHGFNNDTTPRYDKASAELAWKRTIDFFKKNLG